ncbi:MAG: phenylacetate--CoA ligase family protein [Chloroflexi bacterium]|nr:phenylacetate--CoA ligase family protein [Chloroflexota bacterium]
MSALKSLYLKLPIPLQQAACSMEGWRIRHNRYTRSFRAALQKAEERAFWSKERITNYRDERMQRFVKHCAETVPYYKRLFREIGITPDDIRTLEDLQVLPILTKQDVKDNYAELLSEAVPKSQRVSFHTSGTTGSGLHFATTRASLDEQWASVWRFRRSHGIQLGMWCGYFAGRFVVPLEQNKPPFWRINYPGRQIIFSGAHMSEDNLGDYIAELNKRRPPYLQGYPSMLTLLAAYMVETGKYLDYPVKWVVTNSENLLPYQAALLEQAFGARPIQRYAMSEAAASASECVCGRLHIDEDMAATEIVPAPDGFGYRVLGSAFTNLALPLLRYDVGDLATISDGTCPCGRPGRILASIDGRKDDYIILPNGARLGGWVDLIFQDMAHVREAQVYQQKIDEIILRVAPAATYTQQDEMTLLRLAQKRVGDDVDVRIEYLDRLERAPNGKLRCVVSEIKEGQLESVV